MPWETLVGTVALQHDGVLESCRVFAGLLPAGASPYRGAARILAGGGAIVQL